MADAALHGLVAEAFHRAYQARYSRPPPAVPIDLVHARVVLRGRREATAPAPRLGTAAGTGPERREVRFEAGT